MDFFCKIVVLIPLFYSTTENVPLTTNTGLSSAANISSSASSSYASTLSSIDLTIPSTPSTKIKAPTERNFKSVWKQTYNWLEFDVITEKAFCRICRAANEKRFLHNVKMVNNAFTTAGFSDWKIQGT